MKLLLLLAILSGCVVPYGETPQTSMSEASRAASPMGDLTGLEARLLMLMDENQDADRASRLEALRSLLRRCRTWTPEAQRDLVVYLEAILAVEERWRGDEGLEGFGLMVPVDSAPPSVEIIDDGIPVVVPMIEEALDDSAPLSPTLGDPDSDAPPETETPDRNLEATRDEGLVGAREALAKGDYHQAIQLLDQLTQELQAAGDDGEPDEQLATLRSEAVDGWVHTERERAGKLFLAARGEQDADARRQGLEQVVAVLAGLLADYPDSSYADAISRNLQLVKRELGPE